MTIDTIQNHLAIYEVTGEIQDFDTIIEDYDYTSYAVYMEDGRKFILRINHSTGMFYVDED